MKIELKMNYGFGVLVLAAHLAFLSNCSGSDLVIGSFSGTNFGDWKKTGTAFN